VELLADLREREVVHGIATSGRRPDIDASLTALGVGRETIGLLSGGYGEDELTRAGAYRVYRDAAELHASLDELGV
jgi:phosphoglycolate phosphatase-like HAD superfamily hydrolase